jgi:hypothetical protein
MIRAAYRWLFRRPDLPRDWPQVIVWWELRRIPYNLIAAPLGVASLWLVFAKVGSPLGPDETVVGEMLVGLVTFWFLANVAYTAGWILELAIVLAEKRDTGIGLAFFKVGIVFSLSVIGLPIVTWGLYRYVKAIGW